MNERKRIITLRIYGFNCIHYKMFDIGFQWTWYPIINLCVFRPLHRAPLMQCMSIESHTHTTDINDSGAEMNRIYTPQWMFIHRLILLFFIPFCFSPFLYSIPNSYLCVDFGFVSFVIKSTMCVCVFALHKCNKYDINAVSAKIWAAFSPESSVLYDQHPTDCNSL